MDTLPTIAWITDPAGGVTYFNEAWVQFTGVSADQGSGGGWKDVLHADDAPTVIERWSRSVATGERFENVHRFRRADGEFRWQLVRGVPLRGADGAIERWIGTCTDIDDQRRANDAANFLAHASAELAALSDPQETLVRIARLSVPGFADWAAVDAPGRDGVVRRVAVAHPDVDWLARAQDMEARYPSRGTPAQVVLESGEPMYVPQLSEERVAATAQSPEHLEWLREVAPVSYVCVPLTVRGEHVAAVTFVFSRDSGRKYRAIDLTTARDLAQRASVALDNARLYDELRRADRQKSEFLVLLAHELRNPLAPIRSALELLASGVEVGSAVATMERHLGFLEHLVDDLLDVDRIARGTLRIRREPVRISMVLDAALETSAPHLRAAGHTVVRSGSTDRVMVSGDPTRLVQVFGNLLNNAARYTPPGGRVELGVRRAGASVEVSVTDNGVGLNEVDLERVFDLFVRATEDPDGLGLGIGLTLVKQLVEQHGGFVRATSPGLGLGSTFVVSLPALEGHQPEAPPSFPPPPPPEARGVRVVLADDNREAVDLLGASLRMLGHAVRVEYDGAAALRAIEHERPDVAVLDIGMPYLDGYEVARRVRAADWGHEIVLVALSGWGQAEERRASTEAGFDRHVMKPVKRVVLQELLAAVAALQGARGVTRPAGG